MEQRGDRQASTSVDSQQELGQLLREFVVAALSDNTTLQRFVFSRSSKAGAPSNPYTYYLARTVYQWCHTLNDIRSDRQDSIFRVPCAIGATHRGKAPPSRQTLNRSSTDSTWRKPIG
jgi:hypothetical protein